MDNELMLVPIGTSIENMSDRAIAEETLIHLRAITDLISQIVPIVAEMQSNPMGVVKMLMKM